MPRSLIRGSQVLDGSITDLDLAVDSVITEKIKDKNVTRPKLADDVTNSLLSFTNPVGRTVLTSDLPANTNLTIPGGLSYSPPDFVNRVLIYRNGQLQYSGDTAPVGDEIIDVYPGDSNTQIKFAFEVFRGATIQVVVL